jgi:hypothetical protein
MGAAAVLVAELRARGLRLRLEGETLLVAPRGRLTEADHAIIRANKTELLAALQAETADPLIGLAVDIFPGAMVVRCPSCGGDRWRADRLDGERCIACGRLSPCGRAS